MNTTLTAISCWTPPVTERLGNAPMSTRQGSGLSYGGFLAEGTALAASADASKPLPVTAQHVAARQDVDVRVPPRGRPV